MNSFVVYVIACENARGLPESIADLPGFLTVETLEEDLTEEQALNLVEKIDKEA